jgi:hypothetical protein
MRHVFFLFDESGSMKDFGHAVRTSLQALHESKPDDCVVGFIGFSDYAIYGDTIDTVREQFGSTNIAAAFELLQVKLRSIRESSEVAVVFISDGCDSREEQCLAKLRLLLQPTLPCVFFCVGVGPQFPTSLAIEYLRPLYHSAGSNAWPAVIPLREVAETPAVFAELEALLFYRQPDMRTFNASSSVRDLITACNQVYNKAVNQCATTKNKDDALRIIDEAMELLGRIHLLAQNIEHSTASVDTSFLPLASNLLQAALYNTKRCKSLSETMQHQLHHMRRQIADAGVMLNACSDAEKQKVLSYGHVVGRHTKNAHAHHSAQYHMSKNTLRTFLSQYTSNEHDEALEDKINWCSQAAYFQDARASLADIMPNIPTLIHVMEFVPIVCRTLTLKLPMPQGIQMNPWLGKIEGMPTILTHMTTYDFFERFNKKKASSHGELVNGIMLVTKDPSGSILSRGFGKHLASYLLTRNSDLYFPDADLATWAMVAVFILSQEQQPAWMAAELDTLRIMNKAVYAQEGSWTRYMDVVASEEFRKALVKDSDEIPRFCSCPHINKFILAAFFRADTMTAADLEERRIAALVEFFGRASFTQLSEVFEGTFTINPVDVLEDIEFHMHSTLQETLKAFKQMLRTTFINKLTSRPVVPWNVRPKIIESIATKQFSMWNLNPASISQIFKSIAALNGQRLPDIDDDTWAALALTGFATKTSIGRSRCERLVTLLESRHEIENNLVEKFTQQVHKQAHGFVGKKFDARMLQTHQGLPVLITPNFAAKFKELHGRDLIEELDVNDYGLSRNACMHPQCPFFAKPLGKKAKSRDGKPRMCDRLRQHLGSLCSIGGLHRTTLTNPTMEPSSICEQALHKLPLHMLVSHEVHNLLQHIRNIRAPIPWENFERLFTDASPSQPP